MGWCTNMAMLQIFTQAKCLDRAEIVVLCENTCLSIIKTNNKQVHDGKYKCFAKYSNTIINTSIIVKHVYCIKICYVINMLIVTIDMFIIATHIFLEHTSEFNVTICTLLQYVY